jgi:nicotianamine synthase
MKSISQKNKITASQPSTQRIVQSILTIHQTLTTSRDLSPSPHVNEAFFALVSLVLTTSHDEARAVLKDAAIQKIKKSLLKICSTGEYLLEHHWAHHIHESAEPDALIRQFPYYPNYEKIAALEYENMKRYSTKDPKKVLFIGSGPLPLSSILMARTYGLSVDNLDLSHDACDISRKLIHKLGLREKIRVYQGDIATMNTINSYDVVCLAALAGETSQEKKEILKTLSKKISPHALLIVRDASDLGELLYRTIPSASLKGFRILARCHSEDDVINPIIVAERYLKNDTLDQAHKAVKTLLDQYRQYNEAKDESTKARISDAMTFANPIVWMMYKHQAYKKTSHAITTLGDLKEHCSDPDDICAKRFHFLSQSLRQWYAKNITDTAQFPDATPLEHIYQSAMLQSVVHNKKCMHLWEKAEYYLDKGRVAKWEKYSIGKK